MIDSQNGGSSRKEAGGRNEKNRKVLYFSILIGVLTILAVFLIIHSRPDSEEVPERALVPGQGEERTTEPAATEPTPELMKAPEPTPELMRATESMKAMIISDLHYTEHEETDNQLVPGIALAQEIADAIVAEVIERHPDVLIMTGDNTNCGYPDDVAALVAKLQKVRDAGIPIIMTTGNHDYDIMDAAAFEEAYFCLLEPVDRDPASLSYTAIVKDVVFLAMDDNAVNPGGQGEFSEETMRWVGDILAKYRENKIIFLSHHNVLYGYGEEDTTSHLIQNAELPELLRENGVQVAMTGHMHFPYISEDGGLWEILSGMPFSGAHLIGNLEVEEERLVYYAEPIEFAADVAEELEKFDRESEAYMAQIFSELLEREGIYGFRKKKVLNLLEKFVRCYSEGTLAEHATEIREDASYDLMIKGLWNYNYGAWIKTMVETTKYSGRELEIEF